MRRNVKNDINRYKWKQIHESLNEEFQNMLGFNKKLMNHIINTPNMTQLLSGGLLGVVNISS
jgi:hypothetical protein